MAMAMAMGKSLLPLFLLSLLLLQHLVDADEMIVNVGPHRNLLEKINCGAACAARCRLSRRPNLCHRACGTCCARCNCVPPGTSGNQETCPCYYNQTTHGGRRKCP